jgi:hypothetical protein
MDLREAKHAAKIRDWLQVIIRLGPEGRWWHATAVQVAHALVDKIWSWAPDGA